MTWFRCLLCCITTRFYKRTCTTTVVPSDDSFRIVTYTVMYNCLSKKKEVNDLPDIVHPRVSLR